MFIGFVTEGKNSPPKPEVWTNIITGGEVDFVQNFIPMSEIWTNITTGGKRTSSKTLYQCLRYGRILSQGGSGLRPKPYTNA